MKIVKRLFAWTMALAILTPAAFARGNQARSGSPSDGVYFGVVQTEYGPVSGKFENNVTYYRGIPYAAPPVGNLRWRAPEAPAPWTETLACEYNKPMAPQGWHKTYWWADEFYYDVYPLTYDQLVQTPSARPVLTGSSPLMSEDCLYLNVVTPSASTNSNLPVFIWFHGGANANGYVFEPEFEPSKLAAKGVVVVTVAFRIGIFGYLATPELSSDSPTGTSGNYGLLDQIKSIEWVRDNIAKFGGNPNNITIGGQSAGASAVHSIIRSPLAIDSNGKRIFQRAIMDSSFSALAAAATTKTQAENNGKTKLREYGKGYENFTATELRALSMKDLIDVPRDQIANGYGPHNDGWALDKTPLEYFAGTPGSIDDLTILYGSNDGESNSNDPPSPAQLTNFKTTFFANLARDYTAYLPAEDTFDKLFPVRAGGDVDAWYENWRLSSERGGIQHLLIGDVLSRQNPNAKLYAYYFSHWTPGRQAEIHWAWHSSELWYFFNSMRSGHPVRNWKQLDYEIGEKASSYWANFMRSGDPNGKGLPEWPRITKDNAKIMDLGDTFVPKTGFYQGTPQAGRDIMMRNYVITTNNLAGYLQ
jgi:para-nitrobenzyl esterase